MWCTWVLTLAFLPRSSGTQEKIVSSTSSYRAGTEGLADGCYQLDALPPRQGLSPSDIFLSYELRPQVDPAGDRQLPQPNAPSYSLHPIATHERTPGPQSPTHTLRNPPHEQLSHSPSYSFYAVPQQSTSTSGGVPDYMFQHTPIEELPPHIRLTDEEYEALQSLDNYLMNDESSDPPPMFTTHPPVVASPSILGSQSATPSSTKVSTEPQNQRHVGADISRQMLASSTAASPGALANGDINLMAWNNQWMGSFQGSRPWENSSVGSREREEIDSGARPYKARKTITTLESKNPTNGGLYKSTTIVSDGRARMRKTTAKQYRDVKLSMYAEMHEVAARFQRSEEERWVMIEKTVKKWLPVYTTTFKSGQKSPEIEAKLAILFEQLWLMNMLLLLSFDLNILSNTQRLQHGQEEIMTWVTYQMTIPDGILSLLKPFQHLPSEIVKDDSLETHFYSFLREKRQTEYINVASRTKKEISIETESALACKLAVRILDTYYKTSDEKRYVEIFDAHATLARRLIIFTNAKRSKNDHNWSKFVTSHYGTNLVPWSKNTFSLGLAHVSWDDSTHAKYRHICKERANELNQQARMMRIIPKKKN